MDQPENERSNNDNMLIMMIPTLVPGDLMVAIDRLPGRFYHLHGPYHPDDIQDVLTRFANDACKCGDMIEFYYQASSEEGSFSARVPIMHAYHTN